MQNHIPQSMDQQPSTPNINSTSLDTRPYYAPGYRDHSMQMLAPVPSFSSGSFGAVPGSNQSGNDVQKLNGATLSKNAHHLQPPVPTVSNQFSYVQADTNRQTQPWMDRSSSPFVKRSQFVHETHEEHFYGHQGRMRLAQHENDGRCRYSTPIHSGSSVTHHYMYWRGLLGTGT